MPNPVTSKGIEIPRKPARQKDSLSTYLTLYTRINSKQIKHLIVTIKSSKYEKMWANSFIILE